MYLFFVLQSMFLVLIVKQKYASASKCLQIRNTHSYDGLENTHIVTNTLLREGYITGCNLLSIKVALCVHAWCMCVCVSVHAYICVHMSSSVLEYFSIYCRSGTFNGHFDDKHRLMNV